MKKIWKRIGSGIAAAACTFSMLGTNLPNIIEANAATTTYYHKQFPEDDRHTTATNTRSGESQYLLYKDSSHSTPALTVTIKNPSTNKTTTKMVSPFCIDFSTGASGLYYADSSNAFRNSTNGVTAAQKKELFGLLGYFGYPYGQGILNSNGKTLKGMNGDMFDATQLLVWEVVHGNRRYSDFALIPGDDFDKKNPSRSTAASAIHAELHNRTSNDGEYYHLSASAVTLYNTLVERIRQYKKIQHTKPDYDGHTAYFKYNYKTGLYEAGFYDDNYVTDVSGTNKITYPLKAAINGKTNNGAKLNVTTTEVTVKGKKKTLVKMTSTKPVTAAEYTITVDADSMRSLKGSPYNSSFSTKYEVWRPSDSVGAQAFAYSVTIPKLSAKLKVAMAATHDVDITKIFKNVNGDTISSTVKTTSGSKTLSDLINTEAFKFKIKEKTSGKYVVFTGSSGNYTFSKANATGTTLSPKTDGTFKVTLPNGTYILEEVLGNLPTGINFSPAPNKTFTVDDANSSLKMTNKEEKHTSNLNGSIRKYWLPKESDGLAPITTSELKDLVTNNKVAAEVLNNTYFTVSLYNKGTKYYLKNLSPSGNSGTYQLNSVNAIHTEGKNKYISYSGGLTTSESDATKIQASNMTFIGNNGFSISIPNQIYVEAVNKITDIDKYDDGGYKVYFEEHTSLNSIQWKTAGNVLLKTTGNKTSTITNMERYFQFKTTKVDAKNNQITIPGATYGLYDSKNTNSTSDDVELERAITDENGVLKFESRLSLPTSQYEARYYFKEIDSPNGYTIDSNAHYIDTVGWSIMFKASGYADFKNYANIFEAESLRKMDTFKDCVDPSDSYYTKFFLRGKPSSSNYSSIPKRTIANETPRLAQLNAIKLDSFKHPVANVTFALEAVEVYDINGNEIVPSGYFMTANGASRPTISADSATTLKSDANGKVTWTNLYPGIYRVYERHNPNSGFVPLEENHDLGCVEVKLDEDITKTLSVNNATFYNEIQKGELIITKQGPNGEKLEGAEFDIKLTEDFTFNGHVVQGKGTIFHCKTDSDGKAYSYKKDANSGNIVYYPLYVGAKYQIVETEAPRGYKLNTAPEALVFAPNTTANLEYVKVNKVINNDIAPISVKIVKVDENIPTKKLDGAAFAIYADEDLTAYKLVNGNWVAQSFAKGAEIEDTNKNPKRFTDSNGELTFSYSFPKGSKVYIKETLQPKNYVLDPAPYHTTVSSNTATFTVTRTNAFKLVQVQVNKKYKNFMTNAETNIAVNGAKFTLYANDTVVIGDKTYNKDQIIESDVQSVNGKATFTTNLPVNHSYYVLETYAPKNYVKSSEKKVITINENDPDVVNGGNYVLRSVDIYNTTKTAKVTVVKQRLNSNGTTTGVYDKTLEGAKFKLIAAEQIKLPDGTIFAEKNAEIEEVTIATVTEGGNKVAKATFTTKIPTGFKYTLKESQEPNGYVKSNYSTTFTATDNQAANIEYVPVVQTVGNKPISVSFSKKNAANNSELAGASIEVRDSTGAIAKTIDGTEISWISDGTVHTVSGVTPGDYTMVETAAPKGFDIATSIKFHVNADGTVTSSGVTVQSANDIPLIVMIDGATGVQIIKQDADTNAALAGAKFQIRDKETNAIVVPEWTNPVGGKIISGVLVVGKTYILEETQAPAGYLKASPKEFTVTNTSNVQTVAMTDKPIPLQVSKRKLTDNSELAGAHLEIQNTSGTVVKNVYGTSLSWISDGSDHLIKGIPAGSYKLVETAAPEGYTIQTSIPFTIDANGNVTSSTPNTVTMKNNIPLIVMLDGVTGVRVIKKDANTNANLAGAKFQIRDKATNAIVVSEWTNPVGGKVISGVLVVGKTYILEETAAPSGYLKASPKEFTVTDSTGVQTVAMTDKPISLQISKRKLVDNSELAGAKLEIRRTNGTIAYDAYGNALSWTSNGTDHLVNGIIAGDYVLVETAAPSGYVIQTSIPFTVATNGSVTSSKPNTVTMKNNIPLIVMLDDVTKVRVIKKDIGTNLPIENARLQIRDKATNTIVVSAWDNSKSGRVIEGVLVVGRTYILEELTPPPGYTKARNVEFTVTQTAEIQEVEMKDDYNKVQISKKDMATGEEIAGATLIITDSNGNEVARWITNGSAHEVDRLPAGKYTLTEIDAPDGYALSESIEFTVTETGEIQTVTMYDQRLTELPSAGGIGTTLFAIAGFGLMSIALFLIRRKED